MCECSDMISHCAMGHRGCCRHLDMCCRRTADADFLIYHNLENCVAAEPTCLDGGAAELKALRKFMACVGALDGVREYLATRPPMGVGADAGGVGLAGSIMATTVDRDD